jgi:cobalt-zinc-cadmium efflux system protein
VLLISLQIFSILSISIPAPNIFHNLFASAKEKQIRMADNLIQMHFDVITEKRLRGALILTSFIFFAEVMGGIISGSLALLSDAVHALSDVFALGLSWIALVVATKSSTASKTFGYHRVEIFAALINGVVLLGICMLIFYEAYHRVISPTHVKGFEMFAVAVIGLLVNIWVAYKLRGYSDLNVRSAFLHVVGDALSSVGVIVSALIIMFTAFYAVDAIASILVGAIIVVGSLRVVRESLRILVEASPPSIDLSEILNVIRKTEGIEGVHDLHVWSICSNVHAMSAHLVVGDVKVSQAELTSRKITQEMKEKFGIVHCTFQFEKEGCEIEKVLCELKHAK